VQQAGLNKNQAMLQAQQEAELPKTGAVIASSWFAKPLRQASCHKVIADLTYISVKMCS